MFCALASLTDLRAYDIAQPADLWHHNGFLKSLAPEAGDFVNLTLLYPRQALRSFYDRKTTLLFRGIEF